MLALTQTATVVPLKTDERGVVRVAGTRVTLESVVFAFLEGATSEEIVQRYPVLELADVYAVIAWYLKNREAVEGYLAAQSAEAALWKARMQALFPVDGLRARLLSRRAKH